MPNWFRGDYANLTAGHRPDVEPAGHRPSSPAPGGRATSPSWNCSGAATVGQLPSPYTAATHSSRPTTSTKDRDHAPEQTNLGAVGGAGRDIRNRLGLPAFRLHAGAQPAIRHRPLHRHRAQLPRAAGLYERANVTYRGSDIGEVKSVRLTDTGVAAVLSLRSDVKIPADLEAEVHSTSAVGEQYIALLPRSGKTPDLKDGDVIRWPPPVFRPTSMRFWTPLIAACRRFPVRICRPPSTSRDPRSVDSGRTSAVSSRAHPRWPSTPTATCPTFSMSSTMPVPCRTPRPTPQIRCGPGLLIWRRSPASSAITTATCVASSPTDQAGPKAARALLERVRRRCPSRREPGDRVDSRWYYRPDLEQLLVLLPQGIGGRGRRSAWPTRTPSSPTRGAHLSFNLNVNLPPPCTTGFCPPSSARYRAGGHPDRPAGDLYCRVPQDSPFNVRGVRNIPCETRPDKRAPTVRCARATRTTCRSTTDELEG